MTPIFDPTPNPWDMFAAWFAQAQKTESTYADAMALATVGEDGMPSSRIVLMKGYDADGIVFYTNRESRKGQHLAAHPKAALSFHWKSQQRQIHIEGLVAHTSDAESDAYFATRPRGSQIGAWASHQSHVVADRATLEQRAKQIEEKYKDQIIPRPPYWGGYRLAPVRFEFWQEQTFRLHDRVVYLHNGAAWQHERLYP